GGNLQLEDFIKRATPAYRAQAGITDEEWQRFLTKAADYDAILRKLQKQPKSKTPLKARGTAGQFGSVGPTAVQAGPNAVDPSDSGRAEPPPELRDAVGRFRA